MSNPFEDADASYRVVVNEQSQHSLWPACFPVPEGWAIAYDTDSRARCVQYIVADWVSLQTRMPGPT